MMTNQYLEEKVFELEKRVEKIELSKIISDLPSINKPCEDAIRREAVIEILTKYNLEMSKIAEDVNELPSVTQKSGKWIGYNYPAHECVYCSNCKTEYYEDDLYLGGSEFPNFCPNCGARMESEERTE